MWNSKKRVYRIRTKGAKKRGAKRLSHMTDSGNQAKEKRKKVNGMGREYQYSGGSRTTKGRGCASKIPGVELPE